MVIARLTLVTLLSQLGLDHKWFPMSNAVYK